MYPVAASESGAGSLIHQPSIHNACPSEPSVGGGSARDSYLAPVTHSLAKYFVSRILEHAEMGPADEKTVCHIDKAQPLSFHSERRLADRKDTGNRVIELSTPSRD